jgi:hypothetical protein
MIFATLQQWAIPGALVAAHRLTDPAVWSRVYSLFQRAKPLDKDVDAALRAWVTRTEAPSAHLGEYDQASFSYTHEGQAAKQFFDEHIKPFLHVHETSTSFDRDPGEHPAVATAKALNELITATNKPIPYSDAAISGLKQAADKSALEWMKERGEEFFTPADVESIIKSLTIHDRHEDLSHVTGQVVELATGKLLDQFYPVAPLPTKGAEPMSLNIAKLGAALAAAQSLDAQSAPVFQFGVKMMDVVENAYKAAGAGAHKKAAVLAAARALSTELQIDMHPDFEPFLESVIGAYNAAAAVVNVAPLPVSTAATLVQDVANVVAQTEEIYKGVAGVLFPNSVAGVPAGPITVDATTGLIPPAAPPFNAYAAVNTVGV